MSPKQENAQSSSSSRRKSFSKRPLVQSDDDDPPVKRARTVDTDASLSDDDNDNDMDVDIDTPRERSLSAANDSRFLPEDVSAQDHNERFKTRKKLVSASTKKAQMLYSDDSMECDSVEDDLSDLASPLSEVDDDEELDTHPKGGAAKATAGTTKGKAGKGKPGQFKGPKDKDKEIVMKDERKLTIPPASTSRASSAAAQSQPSDLFSNDDLAPSSAVDPLPDASKDPFSQAIPKKRKLPPIKKNKTTTTGTSTPTSTTQRSAPLPVQEPAKPSLPTSEQRKQALTGVRDIDLGDSRVYAELFKGAGGNTPKSGLKNAEERRKELDRMRDEARARRAEDIKYTFDLQSQADKIARFEQRLRGENSTVLHPNFLAAKLRDEWEVERRTRRATPKEEGEA